MGGYGSGRNGHCTTTKIDGGLVLDVASLKRKGAIDFNSWRSGRLTWSMVRTGREVGSIQYEANTLDSHDMWLRVKYTYTPVYNGEPNDMDYKIKLDTTQPNYGGKRLWFVCPITGKRARVLYSPLGSEWFACRHAYSLKYKSQSHAAYERVINKMWKLKDRLGGENYWHKPKGMHHKTHARMMKEICDAEEMCDAYLAYFVRRAF